MSRFMFDPVPTVAPTGPSNAYENIQASPASFGALTAQGEEALGQGAEHAGLEGLSYLQARQTLVNETHASELNTWLADRITDKFSDYAKLEGRAAQTALPKFKADINQLYEDHLASAGDNEQLKAQLAKNGRFLTDAYYRYATNHADQQFKAWSDTTSAQRAAAFGSQAGIAYENGDENAMRVALNTSDDEVAKRLEARGFDQDTIKQEVRLNRGKNLARIIEAQADTDPVKAANLYKTYEGQMDAASSLAVKNKLRAALSTIEGHRVADEETGRTVRDDAGGTVDKALAKASQATGVPLATLRTFARIESGGNPGVDTGSHRGLFQLSDDEFARYGGGDVHNANDNALAAAKKLAAESEAFARQYGRQPSAGELYLIHQQGAGGYAAHMANPDAPAWQNMLSTAEGRRKGEAWAKQAIWGNIPDSAKPMFGSVDNVTSRQFTALWLARVDRGNGNAPLVDKETAFNAILARTANNPAIQAAALARMGQIYSIERADTTNAAAALRQRESDTIAEAAQTGTATNPLSQQDFVTAHGVADGLARYQQYQLNLQALGDRRMLLSAPPDQVATILNQFVPQPGAANYAAASKRYEMLRQTANTLAAERAKDPAAYGVAYLPSVQESWKALQDVVADPKATDAQRAAFARDYAEKQRLEQKRLGIADQDIRILPKDYIERIDTAFKRASTDEDPKARIGLVAQVQRERAMWGNDNWPAVMRELSATSQPIVRAIAAGADTGALVQLLSVPPGDAKKPSNILQQQNATKFADLKSDLNSAFADWQGTLEGVQRGAYAEGWYNLGLELAAIHVRDGDSSRDAAKKAFAELIGSRYEFKDNWRMPAGAGVSADDVHKGAFAARLSVTTGTGAGLRILPAANDIGVADNPRDSEIKVRRDGRWVTSADESGLDLYYDKNRVLGADRKPVHLTWAQLAAQAKDAPRMRSEGDIAP